MPWTMLFARMLVLVAALSVLLAACDGSAPATSPTPNSAAPADGLPIIVPATADTKETLLFSADLSDQISFDPAVAYEFGGIQVVGSVYQTLVTLTPGDPTIKPLLANSWNIKEAADGWTLIFKLDKQATFASGNPVTADDVAYSWRRVLDLN
jgi:peptide/nickel transport system substrate-binding protein